MSSTKCYFALTGDPGVGKTTLIRKLTNVLNEQAFNVRGFYTEEVRVNNSRCGFDVVTLNGNRGRLARDRKLLDFSSKFSLGKYVVLVDEFEKAALPSLQFDDTNQLLVIDEIGKMEMFSDKFKEIISELFHKKTRHNILLTLPNKWSNNLIEDIRNHPQTKIYVVRKENRDLLLQHIVDDILCCFETK